MSASIKPRVNTAYLLICKKCGKKLGNETEKNPARKLRKELKEKAKVVFGKREVKPILTSCMDNCPRGKITVAVMKTKDSKDAPKFFEVKPGDLDATLEILQSLK